METFSFLGKCSKGKLDENSISIRKDDKDDSHIYEEIDLTLLNSQHHHQQSMTAKWNYLLTLP